ncbi:hypothetical protein GALL_519650 [mine drainage metagenome]|uniref:Uncharacterized protein n=1 Tax=mine drainage metagenome TaxID=410659 RepID=A0A1J5P6R7_9ZZZZ
MHAFQPNRRFAHQHAEFRARRGPAIALGVDETQYTHDLQVVEPRAVGKIAGLVAATLAQQGAHADIAQPVDLVDGAQNDAAFVGKSFRIRRIEDARHLHHAVQNLAVVDAHDVVAALDPDMLQRVRQKGAHLTSAATVGATTVSASH